MKKLLCPTCKQDLNEPPHKGLLGRDCPQCGQGIMWRFARRVKRANTRLQADVLTPSAKTKSRRNTPAAKANRYAALDGQKGS